MHRITYRQYSGLATPLVTPLFRQECALFRIFTKEWSFGVETAYSLIYTNAFTPKERAQDNLDSGARIAALSLCADQSYSFSPTEGSHE